MFSSQSVEPCVLDRLACIFSVEGPVLSDVEAQFFRDSKPFGFILFGRNIESPTQVQKLVSDLKEIAGWHCPVLIDQEGGRVQRLQPPHWGLYRPMKYYGDLLQRDPEKALMELRNDTDRISADLNDIGVNFDCAPVLDVLSAVTHEIIGNRAFSDDVDVVTKLGMVVCERFLFNKITPIIKHIPGHGRAASDSHLDLPVVDTPRAELEETDFYPFGMLAHYKNADALWAMSAHVIYSDIDPDHPASASRVVIDDIIRGVIGFNGILLSDDLDMKALDGYGDVAERCVTVLDAGCDLGLYCSGALEPMQRIAEKCPQLREDTLKRLQKAAEVWDIAA